jgi:hypothetical protein
LGATTFILPSLIACRAFAHVCAIIWPGKRTVASFRWIPRPQRPRDADNLAFAGRSEATVVDQKNGAGRQRIGLRIVTRVAPGRAAARPSRSQSSGSAAVSRLWYTKPAGRPIWLPPTAITCLRRGTPRAETMFARSFSRVADGRTTTMLRRDGVRYSTPWTPSGVLPERCRWPRQVGVGGDRKSGDEGDRDDCQHCNLALPDRLSRLCSRLLNHPGR